MEDLKLTVKNIKNIKDASFEFPLEKSILLIVGNNGCGKSTIIQVLSQAISRYPLKNLREND